MDYQQSENRNTEHHVASYPHLWIVCLPFSFIVNLFNCLINCPDNASVICIDWTDKSTASQLTGIWEREHNIESTC